MQVGKIYAYNIYNHKECNSFLGTYLVEMIAKVQEETADQYEVSTFRSLQSGEVFAAKSNPCNFTEIKCCFKLYESIVKLDIYKDDMRLNRLKTRLEITLKLAEELVPQLKSEILS